MVTLSPITHTNPHKCTHIHTRTYHTYACIHMHTLKYTHTQIHTHIHTHVHTHIHIHVHTHSNTHTHTHSCTHTHTHTRTHTLKYTHTYTHSNTHMYTYTHVHTHTYTHTHTHSQSLGTLSYIERILAGRYLPLPRSFNKDNSAVPYSNEKWVRNLHYYRMLLQREGSRDLPADYWGCASFRDRREYT